MMQGVINFMESLYFSNDDAHKMILDNQKRHFESRMAFLNAHNGFRRGSLHVLMGTSGSGKTTLVRTILKDYFSSPLNNKFSLSLWLSEESANDYKMQLSYSIKDNESLLRGFIMSEVDNSEFDEDHFFARFEEMQPDFIVLDNITTSKFYEGKRPNEQVKFLHRIKKLTKDINCATLIVAHTAAGIFDNQDKFIEMNDIRGNKSIVNLAEFFYIVQKITTKKSTHLPFIRIKKHRGQELISDMYYLDYDKDLRIFSKDIYINYEKFVELFSMRARLNGK
jgi:energy-coupling factor transporter ATP-binding protein EcfA2